MALGTRTKFQHEILTSTILVLYKFRENILEGSPNVSETLPQDLRQAVLTRSLENIDHANHVF